MPKLYIGNCKRECQIFTSIVKQKKYMLDNHKIIRHRILFAVSDMDFFIPSHA